MVVVCPAKPIAKSIQMNAMKQKKKVSSGRKPARFAAKILFQFRPSSSSDASSYCTVERRIALFVADCASAAYMDAVRYGKDAQYSWINDDGEEMAFEFVGILDLMHLGEEADDNEVWYEIGKIKMPSMRKLQLIPSKEKLSAFTYEKSIKE